MSQKDLLLHRGSAPALSRAGWLGRATVPLFSRVQLDPEAASRLKRAHTDGTVVHVVRSSRLIDPLFVLWMCDALQIPAPRWVHDHFTSVGAADASGLHATIVAGDSALLFLRRPKTLMQTKGSYAEPLVETLIALQRKQERPIFLFPESLLVHRSASGIRRTVLDAIFGNRESPGRMRELLGFLVGVGESRFHLGAPINLKELLQREGDTSDARVAKKVRWMLLHHLAREEALRTGAVDRPVARTRALVLKDRDVQVALQSEGPDARKRAEAILVRMVSDMRYGWVRVLDIILDRAFSRIFDGIHVDEDGFKAVWSAARRGPVLLIPSHKSHADYLVLSQVFFRRGVSPPFIVAGDNLAIWPIGPMFRRAGAFFIRRKFGGDRLYTALCSAYVRRLLKDGAALEFFIEGGRSRTGKLLAPKLGILTMSIEPVLDGSIHDVAIVPVSIGYEQIIEAKSYAHELEGGEKKKEDLGAILSTPKVLRSKYGRVFVDFDEPISLIAFASARGIDLELLRSGDVGTRRGLVAELGQKVLRGIDRVTRLTPTGVVATVLLSHLGKGLEESDLFTRADTIIDIAVARGARMSGALATDRRASLKEALGRFAQLGLVLMLPSPDGTSILRVEEKGRKGLDYYKNNVLHFYAPLAKVGLSMLRRKEGTIESLGQDLLELDALLALELPSADRVDPRSQTENAVREAVGAITKSLLDARLLLEVDGKLGIVERRRSTLQELANLLLPFLEAIAFLAEAFLHDPNLGRLPEKKLVERALLEARKQVMLGKIRCPEGASKPALENAISLLVRRGALSRKEGTWVAQATGLTALRDTVRSYADALGH